MMRDDICHGEADELSELSIWQPQLLSKSADTDNLCQLRSDQQEIDLLTSSSSPWRWLGTWSCSPGATAVKHEIEANRFRRIA